MSSYVSTEQAKNITDLPVDVISHVFDYLPLAEVLTSKALVSKVFYEAHRQHCRTTKKLTLFGHYIVKVRYENYRFCTKYDSEPQNDCSRKRELISFARSTGNPSSPVINPSTVHLKLVAGQEENAYAAIGDKFKSITHLELFQVSFERHYKEIANMIIAFSSGKGSSNVLADLKVFFSKELYDTDDKTALRLKNNKGCIAYFLAKALTPSNAPVLRRLTLKRVVETFSPSPMKKSRSGSRSRMNKRENHNSYRGAYLKKINLSHVEAIDAPHFENFQQSLTTASDAVNKNNSTSSSSSIDKLSSPLNSHSWTSLKDLTIDLRRNYDWSGILNILNQLTSLTIFLGDDFRQKSVSVLILATVFGSVDDNGSSVSSLTLKDVHSSLLELVRIPYLMDTNKPTTIKNNQHLKHLRVDFNRPRASQINARNIEDTNGAISFLAVTSLHLVNSNFLHGDESDTLKAAYLKLFPNVVDLRLDDNYESTCFDDLNSVRQRSEIHCPQCCALTWSAVQTNRFKFNVNAPINSTTAADCKAALVRRAMDIWPKLTKISLQIEDFYENTLEEIEGAEVKYLYKSETIVVRDEAGLAVPENEQVWKLENVLY